MTAPSPARRRRPRRAVVIGVLVAVMALVGAAAAVWALTRPPSAADAAEKYLTALSEGDFETISEMREPLADAASEAALVDAFAGATYGSAPRVEHETATSDATVFRGSLDLDGERRDVAFALSVRDGRWMLRNDYLATLAVTTTLGDSVWVGDALVPAGTVSLLPAVYPVHPAPTGILTGGSAAVVTNTEDVTVQVEAMLADDAVAQAQTRLDVYLDQCTVPATSLPEACGIRVPWAADLATLDGLAYRVEQRPSISLSPTDGTFAATGGVLVATASGTTRDGTAGSFTYRADDWALYGSLTFTGDEMLLAVR
ncbi:MAG TPA: hypothetical protein VNT50_13770 [Microbacterium sp.]|uniref:hypothetical protein n=1 Tax=Microbacterium sp. TaxID=51671 RepID=UPI002C75A703|nr:hypothetical protein [Microbacterium sp.]HWI32548.1 hypothetical protein [Microbacterium sp.]